MSRYCDLPSAELIAYVEERFDDDHRAAVEAHLEVCPRCRRRVLSSDDIGGLLRSRFPAVDNPAARAEIMARITARAGRPPSDRPRVLPFLPRRLAIAATLTVLLLAVLIPLRAGPHLGALIDLAADQARRAASLAGGAEERQDDRATEVAQLAFHSVEPPTLPLDLRLDQRSTPDANQLELRYRNDAGLIIGIVQRPASHSIVTLSPSGDETVEVITVRDGEVVWLHDPESASVAGLVWESEGVHFELVVLGEPRTGDDRLDVASARLVVEALLDAQQAMERRS